MLSPHISLFSPATDIGQIIIELKAKNICKKETIAKEDIASKLQAPIKGMTLKEETVAQTINYQEKDGIKKVEETSDKNQTMQETQQMQIKANVTKREENYLEIKLDVAN